MLFMVCISNMIIILHTRDGLRPEQAFTDLSHVWDDDDNQILNFMQKYLIPVSNKVQSLLSY